jgi:hypothetical protein
MVDAEPGHRTLLSLDVEKSGSRSDTGSELLRAVLSKALVHALVAAGIDPVECELADTGDGLIAHIPPTVAKTRVITTVLTELAGSLRHDNREAAPGNQVRIRASIHAGELRRDEHGLTGRAKALLARQLDDEQVRRILAEAPATATVVCAVSDSFYRDVIEPGNVGVDPEKFSEITIRNKETVTPAWVTIVGHAAPVVPAEPREPAPTTASTPVTNNFSGITFTGNSTVKVRGDVVQQKNVYNGAPHPGT